MYKIGGTARHQSIPALRVHEQCTWTGDEVHSGRENSRHITRGPVGEGLASEFGEAE